MTPSFERRESKLTDCAGRSESVVEGIGVGKLGDTRGIGIAWHGASLLGKSEVCVKWEAPRSSQIFLIGHHGKNHVSRISITFQQRS